MANAITPTSHDEFVAELNRLMDEGSLADRLDLIERNAARLRTERAETAARDQLRVDAFWADFNGEHAQANLLRHIADNGSVA